MKILVFSDSHGEIQSMMDAVYKEKPDHIIHLGDHIQDAERLADMFPSCPVTRVAGNCDYRDTGCGYLIREFDGVRFFLTHGHRYGVKSGLLHLSYAAMEAEASAALFGHTHCAVLHVSDGCPTLFNPGSCGTYNATYGVIEISQGSAHFAIKTTP